MKPAGMLLANAVQCALLEAFSLLVPASGRCEWRSEWRAELWQVRRCAGCSTDWKAEFEAVYFCIGALPDAIEVRCIARAAHPGSAPIHRSAVFCLLILALILACGWAIALRSPAVIAELHPARYTAREGLVSVSVARAANNEVSLISVEEYRRWAGSKQRFFNDISFYRMERLIWDDGRQKTALSVGRGSANLFTLLGLPMEIGSAEPSADPQLVLSDALWRRDFAADSRILGRRIKVGSGLVRVTAVLPDDCWRLPDAAEAWLIEPDNRLEAGAPGHVVALLTPAGWQMMQNNRAYIPSFDAKSNNRGLLAVSFVNRTIGPWGAYCISILSALLVLPAITSVSRSDKASSTVKPSCAQLAVPGLFFSAKLALLLGILFILPIDLVYANSKGYDSGAPCAQLLFTLIFGLLGFWWGVDDQRKRCPICLRRVTHPARVGIASRTFLAMNGTELMCTGGHTLLYIPAVPTSWFYAPRWVYLDHSWRFLFDA
jgi:hypothetical protein